TPFLLPAGGVDDACGGVNKSVAPRKINTAMAPVHSQKPRCQKTECRNILRIGVAHPGFNCVSNNKDSLQKTPASGLSVTSDRIQNTPAGRSRPRPLHAHQQLPNIPRAMKPAAERARNSCNLRIPSSA